MNRYMLVAAVASAMLYPGTLAGQNVSGTPDNIVSVVVNGESAEASDVEGAFKENEPDSHRDANLPRFAIVGKNREFYLGIGVQLLGEGVFDFAGEMSSPVLFIPSTTEAPSPGNGASLKFGWQTSSIHMNFVAMPESDNRIGVYFKGNFMGNNNSFNCYHFYARYRGLVVGYTNSLFTDGYAEPVTIDFEGPAGYPFITLFTAYWHQQFTKHVSGAIGVDAPVTSFSEATGAEEVNQRLPAIPLYVQYGSESDDAHIRLSAIVRPLQYRNLIAGHNSTLVGGAVQLSGMTPVAGSLSANANLVYGHGIASYILDDYFLGLDACGTKEAGKMELVRTLGITAGLNYAFTSRLQANIVYSHVANMLGDNAVMDRTNYRYGDYVAANMFYNLNRFVSLGLEYDYGHRKSFAGEGLHVNRLQCQFALSF